MKLPLPSWWWKAALGVAGVAGVVAFFALRSRMLTVTTFYNQNIEPWGSRLLGFSNTHTISGFGCMETSLAMASNALAGTEWDPGDMNDIAKGIGAYQGPNLVLAPAADAVGVSAPESERIHPQHGASPAELAQRIDHALHKGGGAIVNVDAHSPHGDGTHFVFVYGKQGGDFVAADPATGKAITISSSTMQASSTWNNHPYVVGVAPVYRA